MVMTFEGIMTVLTAAWCVYRYVSWKRAKKAAAEKDAAPKK